MAARRAQSAGRVQTVYEQLYRTFAAVDRAHERWLTSVGSNGARYAVLAALAGSGRPLTPSDISDGTGRSPNAISPLLRALQDEGLIKRAPNASDRRSHYVALTPVGRRLAQRLRREEASFVRAALGGRSSRELSQLSRSLQSIEDQAGTIQRLS
ncbi:MAG: MarR family transcriptional regulator [Dehalococcoidia bacterium]